jgi:hypothetical protein
VQLDLRSYDEFGSGCPPLDFSSVTAEVMIELLKSALHLRSVVLPGELFHEFADDCLFVDEGWQHFVDIRVVRPVLTVDVPRAPLSAKMIQAMLAINPASDMMIWFGPDFLKCSQDYQKEWICSSVNPLLDGRLLAATLRICFRASKAMMYEEEVPVGMKNFKQATKCITESLSSCKSETLRGFNVSVTYRDAVQDVTWNVGRVTRWDKDIFPLLILNYLREKVVQPLDGPVRLLAVAAINQGAIHRKTTNHTPSDMRAANACVIFQAIKSQFKEGKC